MNLHIDVTINEAATFFRVPARTVRTWVWRYGLTPTIVGRPNKYRLSDINNANRRARGLPPVEVDAA